MIARAAAARPLGLVLLVLGALLLAAPGAAAGEPAISMQEIEDEVMCPTCGTLLSLSSSPQAQRQRVFIREMLFEGRSKQEIKDALVAEFGPGVLAVPQSSGFDLTAWLVPGTALLLAAGGIAIGVRRWRRAAGPPPASPGVDLDPGDAQRLREDLRRYEL